VIPVPRRNPAQPADDKRPDLQRPRIPISVPQPRAAAPLRWTAATPDEMADMAFARARRGGDDALAALVLAASLDERASFGRVRGGLASIARMNSPVADDARWLGLLLAPAPRGPAWRGMGAVLYDVPPDPLGLVKSFAILGPFQDTGGGLDRQEGPEAPGQSFSDMQARYSWGVYEVGWRRVLPSSSTARGIPLDLYIHPRAESCTLLASKITFPAASPGKPPPPASLLVHVAASGSVRLSWDGAPVASSADQHPEMMVDRMAARIAATAGSHLLSLKVCSGAVADEGRVRVRFTDEQRRPVQIASSSDLSGLKITPPTAPTPSKDPARLEAPRASLEKALDLGASPTPAQVLSAAILRTVGGADDSRSPRAPGLLDRIAGTVTRTQESPGNKEEPSDKAEPHVPAAPVTPDALAMAGWISPFGANRSGWLNLARSRAVAEKDPATAAFTQRRLVASRLGLRSPEWAQALANEEPLRSAKDAEARLIRALIKEQLGSPGPSRAALDDLLAITAEQKARTPISVWAEIADNARNEPAVLLAATRRIADLRADARSASYVAAFQSQDGGAMETAAAESLAHQTFAGNLIQIGRSLLEAGRSAWAREVFFLATQLAPNQSAAFLGLAAARQAVAAEELKRGQPVDDPKLATLALARARDLEPSDAFLKAQLAARTDSATSATSSPSHAAMRDEQHIVAPTVFLARARKNPAKKGEVVDRQLHWVRVVTYHPDKRVSQLIHYAREIVIEPRTETDLYERDIPSEGDEMELLLARVHRKDGTVAEPEEQTSGGRRPYVRWPQLKTGDVVEIVIRAWTAGPVGRRGEMPFYFLDVAGSTDTHPLLYNEDVIDSPEKDPLAIDVLNGKPDRTEVTSKDGRAITRFIWDNPVTIADEPFAPQLTESVPTVVGSTFHGWGDFREWYRGAIMGFTEPDDQVKRLAAELTKGKTTRDDKLRALFDFVADDIRYVNYTSGEWYLPNRPQELLARRQGDCDDKAMLLIALLKSIGIEATEVLVQTRYTAQPSLLRSEKAAIPLFDHGIAYLPGKGNEPGLWLDATSPESRLGPLPSMDARAIGFFIHDGPPKIIDTPASTPDDHGVNADWTIRLSSSGAGELSAVERHIGDAAFELRMNLKQADARSQWLEQSLAAGWFPTVQVKPEVDFQGDLPRGAASLRYQALSDGIARREGRELAVPISGTMTLTSQLAPLVKRTLPVVLPPRLAPSHETRNITIVAPAGYSFADLPPGGEEAGGAFGSARLEFSLGPPRSNSVIVKRSLTFGMSTIAVAEYASWRAWLQRVDGLMRRMVRIVPSAESTERPASRASVKSPSP
jgi:hypothetical protein